jgi:hypothetical protein
MRKLVVSLAVVLLFSFMALAQTTPQAELFGGYQYTRVNPGSGLDGINANGWEASINGNFNKWFGLKGDFSGAYNGDLLGSGVSGSIHTFTFGPEISFRGDKGKMFGHALFGGAHIAGGGTGETDFAMRIGGGGDWNFNDRLGWRVVQFDYVPTHFFDSWQHNVAVSTGVVFRFGSK